MNNEEKILALLEKMDGRLSSLETGQASLETGQASLETEITNIGTRQASDREILELTSAQVGNLTNEVGDIKIELADVKSEVVKTNMTIEQDIKPKLSSLFDGYKQNADKLTRIEKEVIKHEEMIWKRVK
ncbi:MAG TPA: hypothetical protein VFD57_01385 [Clostridia bacterium]|nr:hypothetical protein [Clostridia bacterium]